MRLALLCVSLACMCATAGAQQTQSIINTNTADGLTYATDFNITTSLVNFAPGTPGYGGQYVSATMSGTLDINDQLVDTWTNDTWQYLPNQEMTMAGWGPVETDQWGNPKLYEWELISTPSGAVVDDFTFNGPTGVVTPEVPTGVLMLCGLAVVGGLWWKRNRLQLRH